jgi:hypothetical protein
MIEIVPYVEINGTRTATDTYINSLYQTMVKDNLVKRVFVNDQMETSQDFLNHMKSPNILPLIALYEGKPMGVAWLADIKPNTATAHFCFFKCSWGKLTEEMGRAVLDYWFGQKDGKYNFPFKTIIGMTPERNRSALKYIRQLGFKVLGAIPYLDYGVISYLERKDYGR